MEQEILNKILDKLGDLDQKFISLSHDMQEQFKEVRLRFDGVDARFDGVDARFDGVDARFDGIDGRLNGIDGRLDGIDGRLDGIDGRLDGIDTRLERLEIGQQEDILTLLTYMNKRLDETAKKSDVDALRRDIEFSVKESSMFKLELDRLKRNSFE